MLTKIFTASTLGLEAQLIEVEIDLSASLPGIVVVGLPDKAVQESKERIRASLKQSGFDFPVGKITVNLAPADIIKTGTGFDLAIAIGILQLTGILPNFDAQTLFVGELALDGRIRGVVGLLTICLWARTHGYKQIFLPFDNECEVSLVRGLDVFAANNLCQIVRHLQGKELIPTVKPLDLAYFNTVKEISDSSKIDKLTEKVETINQNASENLSQNSAENANEKNPQQNIQKILEKNAKNGYLESIPTTKIIKLQFLLDQFSQTNITKITSLE